MGNIKSLLVEFIMAFLLGIAGFIAMFYIFIALSFIALPFGGWCGIMSFRNALLTGIPLGSSLGISITKIYILRTGKFSVLCLFTSLVFGFFAVLLLFLALYFIGLIGPALSEIIVFPLVPLFAEKIIFFPLVPLFALIGYNAMAELLREIG